MMFFSLHESVSLSLKYYKKAILGEGAYGIVYEGTWMNRKVAVKRIPKEKVQNNKGGEEALQTLNHPNVVKLYDVENDNNFRYIKF
jgi:serine/threonine protein kinase